MYQDFVKLDKEIVRNFILTGQSEAIAIPLQRYIKQINRAAEIHTFDGNIQRCARKLQESFPDDKLALNTARERIYDAINIFHLNNTVRNQAWDNYYADKIDDLAKVAISEGKYKEALLCFSKSRELRTNKDEDAFTPEQLAAKQQLVSPDIKLSRLGLKTFDKKKVWSEGLKFIEKMPLEKDEKEKLENEFSEALGIDDAEELQDNEQAQD